MTRISTLLVVFILGLPALANENCLKVIADVQTSQLSELSKYLATADEFNQISNFDNIIAPLWANKIRSKGKRFYRGVTLTQRQLDVVRKDGFAVNKTEFARIFMSELPGEALDSMSSHFENDPRLGLIFVLDRDKTDAHKEYGITWTSQADIPFSAVREIWIFDKALNPDFPFSRIYSEFP